jgi:hypothetical protein
MKWQRRGFYLGTGLLGGAIRARPNAEPLLRGTPVTSLCALRDNLFLRPVDLGSVDPHSMQDHLSLLKIQFGA